MSVSLEPATIVQLRDHGKPVVWVAVPDDQRDVLVTALAVRDVAVEDGLSWTDVAVTRRGRVRESWTPTDLDGASAGDVGPRAIGSRWTAPGQQPRPAASDGRPAAGAARQSIGNS